MADDEKQPGSNIAFISIIGVTLLAMGTYLFPHDVPLRSSRPEITEAQIHESASSQDIEARLWQDPFSAIAKTIENAPGTFERCGVNLGGTAAASLASHCLSPLAKETDKAKLETTKVIAVTLPGAPNMEDGEVRRRTRYAVSSGLERAGFVPEDAHHLGYFQPRDSGLTLPKVVPYEWFARTGSDEQQEQHVLVLWINEDVLRGSPLMKLSSLAAALRQKNQHNLQSEPIPVSIVGPSSSDILLDMVKEACMAQFAGDAARIKPLSFYAYGPTVDDKELFKQVKGCDFSHNPSVHNFFSNLGITFYRTTATDEVLARGIVGELELRKITLGKMRTITLGEKWQSRNVHHIALISEWDSFYGRTLPNTMAHCFEDKNCPPEENAKKSLVHGLSYVRGLDGQLPGTQETADRKAGKGTGEAHKQASLADFFKTQPDGKDEDHPIGQDQRDYLRRLADRLRSFDDSLRRNHEGGISAIGILGSDVFDKLLLLRALRQKFPEAVFFTTDFDTSLTLSNELDFTRNLIISSSFGPELRPEIQGEIPPFRSSYQTAAFLATRLAVGAPDDGREPSSGQEKISAWLSPSRIFEIGRTGDIIQYPGETADIPARGEQEACGMDLWDCRDVQPPIGKLFPEPENLDLIAWTLAGAALLIGLTLCIRRVREDVGVQVGILVQIMGATAAACYYWGDFAAWLTENGRGEPMALLQGVSVWPTVLLRALIVVLSFYLLWSAWQKLDKNSYQIAREMGLPMPYLAIAAERTAAKGQTIWKKLARIFSYSLREHQPDPGKPFKITIAWSEYVYQGRWVARLLRVAVYTAAMYCLWFYVISPLLGQAVTPQRGEFARHILRYTSKVEFICMMAVMYVVFDATWLCLRFVKDLCRSTTEWPSQTRAQFEGQLGLERQFLDEWIDLDFVAKRTRCVSTLIYYPFILIALVIVTHSTVFANYTPNLKALVFEGTCLAIVFGATVALYGATKAARDQLRQRLAAEFVSAKGQADDRGSGMLQTLLARVDDLHEGAFSSLTQQPVVKTLLLPVGGVSATILADYVKQLLNL